MLQQGQKFQKLTILRQDYKNNNSDWYYICKCECGKEKSIKGSHLKNQKDCGNCKGTNGLSKKHKLYPIYNTMLQRCHNENSNSYKDYGKKGIIVCNRWRFGDNLKGGFEYFIEDMKDRPFDGLSIDRKENSGNYEPDNCKWSTREEQNNNRSNNISVEYKGKYYTLKQLSDKLGIDKTTLWYRHKKGKQLDETTNSTPIVEFEGDKIKLTDLAKKYNIPYGTILHRYKKGYELVPKDNSGNVVKETKEQFEIAGQKMSLDDISKLIGKKVRFK